MSGRRPPRGDQAERAAPALPGALYGPYHRLESPTQRPEIAALQVSTGEIHGRAPRWSDIPAVKAYRGRLPPGTRGVEFMTTITPYSDPHPRLVRWLIHTPGVLTVEDGVVAIPVIVTANTQV
jgi:hypothetical protein